MEWRDSTVKYETDVSDILDFDAPLVQVVAQLRSILNSVPEECRDIAVLDIEAYDWLGVSVRYERPMTPEEEAERLAKINAQREAINGPIHPDWIRNIRMYGPYSDRSEAEIYIRENAESLKYHPDVYQPPRMANPYSQKPWN